MAALSGLGAFYVFLSPAEGAKSTAGLRYLPLAPFLVAVVLHWLVLARIHNRVGPLPLFVVGVARSETCALMRLFLAPEQKTLYSILAVVGLVQYTPVFASNVES